MKENKNISKEAYQCFLNDVIAMVQNRRAAAVQTVQSINNHLYWNIGELILKMQQRYGWGKSIVEKLSIDLQHKIGKGVSWPSRNLWLMRQMVDEYSNLKQVVSDLEIFNSSKLKQAASVLKIDNILKLKQLISEVPSKI